MRHIVILFLTLLVGCGPSGTPNQKDGAQTVQPTRPKPTKESVTANKPSPASTAGVDIILENRVPLPQNFVVNQETPVIITSNTVSFPDRTTVHLTSTLSDGFTQSTDIKMLEKWKDNHVSMTQMLFVNTCENGKVVLDYSIKEGEFILKRLQIGKRKIGNYVKSTSRPVTSKQHRVKEGENCKTIAKRYKITLGRLYSLNPSISLEGDKCIISPGDVLNIK